MFSPLAGRVPQDECVFSEHSVSRRRLGAAHLQELVVSLGCKPHTSSSTSWYSLRRASENWALG